MAYITTPKVDPVLKASLASIKADFSSMKTDFARIRTNNTYIKWISATSLVLLIAVALKLFLP
jgi:hypothetical protein